MSATSTSTDPVQTIVDLLDGTAEPNWPGGTKPTYIERRWDSSRNEKRRRKDPAAYAFSPDIGTQRQYGPDADTKIRTEVIDVNVWARDHAVADTVASDVITILEDYWNDGQASTAWNRIRPQSADDQRGEDTLETVMGRRDNQYIITPRIELEREGSMGT